MWTKDDTNMQVSSSIVWSNFYYPQISRPPTFELWIWCQKLGLYASIYCTNDLHDWRMDLLVVGTVLSKAKKIGPYGNIYLSQCPFCACSVWIDWWRMFMKSGSTWPTFADCNFWPSFVPVVNTAMNDLECISELFQLLKLQLSRTLLLTQLVLMAQSTDWTQRYVHSITP